MFSKVSSAIKIRLGASVSAPEDETQQHNSGEVLASVYQQHPNLSVFHQPEEVPFPSASPPVSPSIGGRRGMFKRMSKQAPLHNESTDNLPKLNTLTKKVKSTFTGHNTGALLDTTSQPFVDNFCSRFTKSSIRR